MPLDFQLNLEPARITKYENTYVEFQGNSSSDRLLILSDDWNKNWVVDLNGKPADLVKVNGVFRGVIVPEGKYKVKLKYKFNIIYCSVIISLYSAIILILVTIFRARLDKVLSKFIHGKKSHS